jgi:chemotaxis protein MotB
MVSYADFITLLFAFFTTLYAISTVDTRKLTAVVDSFQRAFDRAPSAVHAAGPATARAGATPAGAPLERVRSRLAQLLEDPIKEGRVAIEIDKRGLVVSMRESGSFAVGSADLSAPARELIGYVAQTLFDLPNLVRVEGHTDDLPIHTPRFASNWDLSTARATSVVAFLIEQAGVDAGRLSAAGYSQYHPRVANDSEPHRGMNRRVDIVILNPATSGAEEPGAIR